MPNVFRKGNEVHYRGWSFAMVTPEKKSLIVIPLAGAPCAWSTKRAAVDWAVAHGWVDNMKKKGQRAWIEPVRVSVIVSVL